MHFGEYLIILGVGFYLLRTYVERELRGHVVHVVMPDHAASILGLQPGLARSLAAAAQGLALQPPHAGADLHQVHAQAAARHHLGPQPGEGAENVADEGAGAGPELHQLQLLGLAHLHPFIEQPDRDTLTEHLTVTRDTANENLLLRANNQHFNTKTRHN